MLETTHPTALRSLKVKASLVKDSRVALLAHLFTLPDQQLFNSNWEHTISISTTPQVPARAPTTKANKPTYSYSHYGSIPNIHHIYDIKTLAFLMHIPGATMTA